MNYLPINETILNTHKADCWAYYCYLYKCITHTHLNFMDTITVNISIDAARTRYGRAYADLSQPIWSGYSKNWEKDQLLIIGTNTTMMPFEVFEKLHDLIMTLPSRSRSTYCFFYMYFSQRKNNGNWRVCICICNSWARYSNYGSCRKFI